MAMIDLHMLKSVFSANNGSVSYHARIGLELRNKGEEEEAPNAVSEDSERS